MSRSERGTAFGDACALIDGSLDAGVRRRIVEEASRPARLGEALLVLREGMSSHLWKVGPRRIALAGLVNELDTRTRADGFHALHDWDGKALRFDTEAIPINVLNFLIHKGGRDATDEAVLAILLDYYFLYLLGLLSLRVWDDGQPDADLDRLNGLLVKLQGADGSGQQFAADAETLLLIATSHYEPDEQAYDALLGRVRQLDERHQTRIAMGHAACMGSHLRFGFEATYGRNSVAMREDNTADYPWLSFAGATCMREFARLQDAGVAGVERDRVVEAILNAVSPDPEAFVGEAPGVPAACKADREDFRRLFGSHRISLLEACRRYAAAEASYSPFSFFFNFSHNVLKAAVVDALLWGEASSVDLNGLFTGIPVEAAGGLKARLAAALANYGRASPDRIRGRLMAPIVYDPAAGRRALRATLDALDHSSFHPLT